MNKGNSKKVLITHSRRITGLVKGGVTIPELPFGKKNPNLISMNLRKTQTYNHICDLMKLRIFLEVVNYEVNITMPTTTQKIEKMQILNQVSFGKH